MFVFGAKSIVNQHQVYPKLVAIADEALAHSSVDFSFYEGVRSIEQEKKNIANGTSKLINPKDCKHCIQKDGYGHAMDLVPFIDGKNVWDWDACYIIAKAVQAAAHKFNTRIRWGGVWDRALNDLDPNGLEKAVKDYETRHPGKDFLDGVHFELVM